ncbi:YcxB family protein [Streptomyces sp. A1136]|uniref:YcxB family protein n=1 Tax=Streptomyces sp. A1136 TaxID=2563102 RepID=UPI00109E80AD|nr:YcxB family protein [Streptomyces sp. A1136]THA47716.1 YcxB family protein [Streptomyces sp. A1136]
MSDIRQATIAFSGSLTREEFDEAFAATGRLRRLRWLTGVLAVLPAALSLRLSADGGSVNVGMLTLALLYGVLAWLLPRLLIGRAFRADQAEGEKQAVVDDTGVVVSRGDRELVRVPWRAVHRCYETERLYVMTGRLGWKSGLLIVPKRLLTGPGETELLGVLLETRVSRSKGSRVQSRQVY